MTPIDAVMVDLAPTLSGVPDLTPRYSLPGVNGFSKN